MQGSSPPAENLLASCSSSGNVSSRSVAVLCYYSTTSLSFWRSGFWSKWLPFRLHKVSLRRQRVREKLELPPLLGDTGRGVRAHFSTSTTIKHSSATWPASLRAHVSLHNCLEVPVKRHHKTPPHSTLFERKTPNSDRLASRMSHSVQLLFNDARLLLILFFQKEEPGVLCTSQREPSVELNSSRVFKRPSVPLF